MLRLRIGLCFLVPTLLTMSCNGSTESNRTPAAASVTVATRASSVARTPSTVPTALPPGARVVAQTTALGRLTRVAGGTPQTADLRKLVDASCRDGLMTIRTSQETIFAALPCDRFWDDRAKVQFIGKEAAITLEVTSDRYRVLIETLGGAQAEFTVDGIWLE